MSIISEVIPYDFYKDRMWNVMVMHQKQFWSIVCGLMLIRKLYSSPYGIKDGGQCLHFLLLRK